MSSRTNGPVSVYAADRHSLGRSSLQSPRCIAEILPAVLARYGVVSDTAANDSPATVSSLANESVLEFAAHPTPPTDRFDADSYKLAGMQIA